MARLSITCFGPWHVEISGVGELRFQTEKSFDLLVLAALGGGAQLPRGQAAATLRMDQSDQMARRALSTDLWRLRKAFAEAGADSAAYVCNSARGIGLRPDADVTLDLRVFEAGFDRLSGIPAERLDREQVATLTDLAALYRADALPDHDQEWSFVLRERLRSKYTALVDTLLGHALSTDDWPGAIRWVNRLLELDPMLEHAHRALMQCHFLTGNRGIAIRQYTLCAGILSRELGVEPSEETARMYRGLLSVQVTPPPERGFADPAPLAPPPALGLRDPERRRPLTDQLSMALGNLNQARALVENVDGELRRRST